MQMSQNIANVAAALAQFQGLVTNPKKDAVNPHFKSKYADLDTIITTIRPALEKCGLAFLQNPVTDENGNIGVYTIILHKSGEFIQFDPVFIPTNKANPHQVGAALTYARRYSLGAALGIATDEDDDANSVTPGANGSAPAGKTQNRKQEKAPAKQQPAQPAAQAEQQDQQKKRFFAICGKRKLTERQMKALVFGFTGKKSRKDLTEEEFKVLADFIEEASAGDIKRAIEEAAQAFLAEAQKRADDGITDDEIEAAMNGGKGAA